MKVGKIKQIRLRMSNLNSCGIITTPFLTAEKSAKSFTSTSANHLADLAKALYEKNEMAMLMASAVKESHQLIGSNTPLQGRIGRTESEIRKIFLEDAERIIALKTFCAWMREAIKFKEELETVIQEYVTPEQVERMSDHLAATPEEQAHLEDLQNQLKTASSYSDEEIAHLKELEDKMQEICTATEEEYAHLRELEAELKKLEEDPDLEAAYAKLQTIKGADSTSEADVKAKWGIKTMYDYLHSQQAASVYGKAIHKDGTLKSLKDDIIQATNQPIILQGTGAATIAVTREVTMTIDQVEDLEMTLQSIQREHQQKFNSIVKTELTDVVNEFNQSELNRVKSETREARDAYNSLLEPIKVKKAELRQLIRDEKLAIEEMVNARVRLLREEINEESNKLEEMRSARCSKLRSEIRDEQKRLNELELERRTKHEEAVKLADANAEALKKELETEARGLRIVLPKDLEETFEYIKSTEKA